MRNVDGRELKQASYAQLKSIAEELREEIFRTVSVCGGHLSSNLGTVELTMALHRVFDFPRDKIVFDVGHQCYSHKLLSGRAEAFHTLRREGGISGFPKREESEYDCYGTGHAGTAISAALGIAKARDLLGEDYEVIALVGDGSFQNGLIYEALGSIKELKTPILIVLNDNGLSISPTHGGMHDALERMKEGSSEDIRLIERFGVTYTGPVNGNSFEELIPALETAKNTLKEGKCVLLHAVTRKGLGYPFTEMRPSETHGVSPAPVKNEYATAIGEELCRLAEKDSRIAVVTAAMTDSLGLRPFFERFPTRAFDVGICEEHASVLAAGLAAAGMRPFYAVYSTFLQRSFDEIVHDVCLQKLPVTFLVDRGGLTGEDGETHQGVFDFSYLSPIPNLAVATPKNIAELRKMVEKSLDWGVPLAIRYPRAGNEGCADEVEFGKFEVLHSTMSDIIMLAAGERCLAIAERVLGMAKRRGMDFTLVNARFIKPLDGEFLANCPAKHVITLEDNVLAGGFGDAVARFLRGSGKEVRAFGYIDVFIPHGPADSLRKKYGLSEEEIFACVEEIYARG